MAPEKQQQARVCVCHISTVHMPTDVRIFYRECLSLVKTGYEVHLVIPCEQSCIQNGVYIHRIRRVKHRLFRMLFMPWAAIRKALQTKASLYHYHDPELHFIGFVLRRILGKKVVFDMRESTARQIIAKEWLPNWSRKFVSLLYRAIEKVFLNGIVIIVANDKSVEEYEPCYLVRNFPEIDEELMANAISMDKRLEHPLLIYVGGVWKSRGAFTYVDLAKAMRDQGHDINMMIIGPLREEFAQELQARINELHLQDTVTVTGYMDYPEAMKFVSRAAIGLAILKPTPNHSFCLAGKIIEYMMCGTPVLCSRFDHWRPYVEGERTCIMVDPNNMDEIIEACEKMLSNSSELSAMGKRGMQAVCTKYNWNTEFKVLLRCYDDTLKK
jgi:glycosyltransferase involved in cell wall biosynthesis